MDVAAQNMQRALVKDQIAERCQKRFLDFLEECTEEGAPKYIEAARELTQPDRNTLCVDYADVQRFSEALADSIKKEYYRLYPSLCAAVKQFAHHHADLPMAVDVYVSFSNFNERIPVRKLTSTRLGQLICITGQVVRTHPVHPELVLGHFSCADCGSQLPDVVQQFKYTQPSICTNSACGNRKKFSLDTYKSKFVDFQKLRAQETQDELPRGSTPRSVEIILRGDVVECAQAGDRCDFIGTLIVIPDIGQINLPGAISDDSRDRRRGGDVTDEGVSGLKSLGVRFLNYKLAFLACKVIPKNMRVGEMDFTMEEIQRPEVQEKVFTKSQWDKILEMTQDNKLFHNLCDSLFPTIYSNDEIKRGIILMLFGGVQKKTRDGTRLRGDLNVCVIGDPSTAKSQFLKQVVQFSPRAIYTSGKASSAAGLTAAVVRDDESGEFVIEAGALMLADNGICCIDEFDKMDIKDQVAIHESMEQQTISITKAGIKATLNARTSILAAANPAYGRYDRTKSLRQNIQLSAPIMSRFDLFFILIDECDESKDYAIAERIVKLHTTWQQPKKTKYTKADVSTYIIFAKNVKPQLSEEAQAFLVEQYKHLRQRDSAGGRSAWRITVRQLESMIRLTEAVARLHCKSVATLDHAKQAFSLLDKSIIRVEQPDICLDEEEELKAPSADVAMETDEAAPEPVVKEVPISLTYDEYKQMANLLIYRLKKAELEVEAGITEGMKEDELINWYLEQMESQIETEADVAAVKKKCQKVIHRLVHKDKVLLELAAGEGVEAVLVVHPNYVME